MKKRGLCLLAALIACLLLAACAAHLKPYTAPSVEYVWTDHVHGGSYRLLAVRGEDGAHITVTRCAQSDGTVYTHEADAPASLFTEIDALLTESRFAQMAEKPEKDPYVVPDETWSIRVTPQEGTAHTVTSLHELDAADHKSCSALIDLLENAAQEPRYAVDYEGMQDLFIDASDAYPAGARVELWFSETGKDFRLVFEMPDHDVTLSDVADLEP